MENKESSFLTLFHFHAYLYNLVAVYLHINNYNKVNLTNGNSRVTCEQGPNWRANSDWQQNKVL